MGLKEATIGQYYGLLEWRVLMHPQYYLYNTEQSSAVRITMCTRPYVSLAINGSTPPPTAVTDGLVCQITTKGTNLNTAIVRPPIRNQLRGK